MANETTIPLLPCASIDEVSQFYQMLGFNQTHHQTRPNDYLVMQREDLQLHFFGIDGFDPADSYGTCLVFVPDTGVLYEAFAAGMRAEHGKVLVSGIPRMTRPRKRKNTGNLSGFSVTDPGGNVIRIFPSQADESAAPAPPKSALGKALENAIVLGDAKGDVPQAARILDGKLARTQAEVPLAELVEALVYRAELAARLADTERAAQLLARVRGIELSDADRTRLADALANAGELETALDN